MNFRIVAVALALIGEELRVEVAFWYSIYLLVLRCNCKQYIVIKPLIQYALENPKLPLQVTSPLLRHTVLFLLTAHLKLLSRLVYLASQAILDLC